MDNSHLNKQLIIQITINYLKQLKPTHSCEDKWIIHRLYKCIGDCELALNTYQFPDYTTAVHNFWLKEFCDVYLVCFLFKVF